MTGNNQDSREREAERRLRARDKLKGILERKSFANARKKRNKRFRKGMKD